VSNATACARLHAAPGDWPWSSAQPSRGSPRRADRAAPTDLVANWAAFLAADAAETAYESLRAGERTGRPLADGGLTHRLEAVLGRRLQRQKPGPKPGNRRTEKRRDPPKIE
jgi:hypothetical protein